MANQLINLIQKKLQSLEEVLEETVVEVIKQESDTFIELNQEQLLQGKASSGVDMPKYSENTLLNKPNATSDKYTLFDTGDFHRGFYVETYVGEFKIESTDSKNDMLIEENGEDIFGLTEENFDKAFNEIRPIVKEKIEKWIAEK